MGEYPLYRRCNRCGHEVCVVTTVRLASPLHVFEYVFCTTCANVVRDAVRHALEDHAPEEEPLPGRVEEAPPVPRRWWRPRFTGNGLP